MRFSKMHGAGNDFVLVDATQQQRDWPALAQAMCDRNFGVGADGLIIAQPSSTAALMMRTYNPDGSEAEMCGNGIRCFAKFAVENGLATPSGDEVPVETLAGPINVRLERKDGFVVGATADMGAPRLEPRDIPVAINAPGPLLNLTVNAGELGISVSCVSMGNPHAVHFLNTPVADYPLHDVGPLVEHHPLFPARVNYEVVRIIDRGHAEARTWERGAGETLACGTGACAIMVAARLHGLVDDVLEIKEPGGVLTLRWDGSGSVFMSGPAALVYEGDWPD